MNIPDDILSNILDFCGCKQYLFISPINKRTNKLYKDKETSLKNILFNQSTLIDSINNGFNPSRRDLYYISENVKSNICGNMVKTKVL